MKHHALCRGNCENFTSLHVGAENWQMKLLIGSVKEHTQGTGKHYSGERDGIWGFHHHLEHGACHQYRLYLTDHVLIQLKDQSDAEVNILFSKIVVCPQPECFVHFQFCLNEAQDSSKNWPMRSKKWAHVPMWISINSCILQAVKSNCGSWNLTRWSF